MVILLLALTVIAHGCVRQPQASHERVGVLGRYPMTPATLQQWKLPKKLREISGLAVSDDGQLFAVADEEAIVYQIDYDDGHLVKAFALGKPTVKGDFEGIAAVGGEFFLTTSDGDLFRFREGDDGERVDYTRTETGLGEHCEIEGLAARAGELLFLCKEVRSQDILDSLAIFRWSTDTGTRQHDGYIALPEADILQQVGKKRLSPSGLAVDAATGNLVIVAARQKVLAELSPVGELVQAMRMPLKGRHRQAEGIEFSRSGRLLISDEGGSRRARIAIYGVDAPGDRNE